MFSVVISFPALLSAQAYLKVGFGFRSAFPAAQKVFIKGHAETADPE